MKKLNIPLLLGSIILIFIIILMLFPDMIASKSPYTMQHMRFSTENNKLQVEAAPYPPSSEFIFGSDDLGRNIFSFMVYGTKLTILLGIFMSLGQFLIAIPFSIIGGFGHKTFKSIILQGNVIFSAIPALLISIIILQLDFFVSLNKVYSMLAFVLVITFVGWPKLGKLLMERVEAINQQPFIRGEVAIGKRRSKIAIENVIPHLVPEIIVLFFMEIARNLSMIMQLGVFGVFIGNLKIIKDSSNGLLNYYDVSFEPEWASMLGSSRTMITAAPWAVLFPALAFFVSVLGFNLFGEGIRDIVQKRDSRLIPTIRNLLRFDIKKIKSTYFKRFKSYKSVIGIGVLVILFIMSVTRNTYDFDYDNQSVDDFEQVVIGSIEATKTVSLIESKMRELGIVPMEGDDYKKQYSIGNVYQRLSQSMKVNLGDERREMNENIDFTIVSFADNFVEGNIYDATREDLYNNNDFQRFKDKFVLINKTFYNEPSIAFFISNISENVSVKGFLLIESDETMFNNVLIDKRENNTVILISKSTAETLIRNENALITLTCETKEIQGQGTNIIGYYEGEDIYLNDEAIVIGLSYNYLETEGQDVLKFNLELMERLCQLEGNKRSLIFLFLDGTISDTYHGIYAMADDFPYSSQKVKAYLDLTRIKSNTFDTIELSLEQAPITRQFAWSLGHLLDENIIKNNIKNLPLKSNKVGVEFFYTKTNAANQMFWKRGIASIIIGTKTSGTRNINELGSIILEAVNKNNY